MHLCIHPFCFSQIKLPGDFRAGRNEDLPKALEPYFLRDWMRFISYAKRLVSSCQATLVHPWYIHQYRELMVGIGTM